jgi:hypothetical protein
MHPKARGLLSREIAYASRLWYLHSLPHAKGVRSHTEKIMQEYDSSKKENRRLK